MLALGYCDQIEPDLSAQHIPFIHDVFTNFISLLLSFG